MSKPITFKLSTLKPPQLFIVTQNHMKRSVKKIIACSYCKRTGHDRDKCYKRLRDKEQIRTLKEIERSDTDISDSGDENEISDQNNLNSYGKDQREATLRE